MFTGSGMMWLRARQELLPNIGLVVAGAHPPLSWSERHASALDGCYQAPVAVMFQGLSLPGEWQISYGPYVAQSFDTRELAVSYSQQEKMSRNCCRVCVPPLHFQTYPVCKERVTRPQCSQRYMLLCLARAGAAAAISNKLHVNRVLKL